MKTEKRSVIFDYIRCSSPYRSWKLDGLHTIVVQNILGSRDQTFSTVRQTVFDGNSSQQFRQLVAELQFRNGASCAEFSEKSFLDNPESMLAVTARRSLSHIQIRRWFSSIKRKNLHDRVCVGEAMGGIPFFRRSRVSSVAVFLIFCFC